MIMGRAGNNSQHAFHSLRPSHSPRVRQMGSLWQGEPILQTLVVAFVEIMGNEFMYRFPQGTLSEENQRSRRDSLIVLTNLSACAI
jgi:hypothetical protein